MAERPSDYKPWKTLNDVIQTFPIVGGSSWADVLIAERKSDKKRYLRLKRPRQGYNIWTPEDLSGLIQSLQDGANAIGWQIGPDSQNKKLLDAIERLKGLRKKDLEQIQNLGRRYSELRQQQIKLQVPEYKEDLTQFSDLLKTAEKEKELQGFLASHTWLFGLEYLDQQSDGYTQFRLSDSKFDFLLQRYDTFYDIFEIKLPSAPLFKPKVEQKYDLITPNRESPISSELKDAISQMIGYLETTALHLGDLLLEKQILLHKPKGFIIIGRSEKKEQRALTTLNFYLNHFQILTYDDILKRGRNLVAMLEKRRVPK